MWSSKLIFMLVVSFLSANVQAQRCDPGPVENLTFLSSYYLLNWSKPLNYDNCTLQAYVISVRDLKEQNEFQVHTNLNSMSYNFNFLDMCSNYVFMVRVLTDQHLLGPSKLLNVTTIPSDSLNLTLNLSNFDDGRLNWIVSNYTVAKCVSYYRVVYWDNDTNSPIDLYVKENNFYLLNATPCTVYKVRVSAIVDSPDLEGPVVETVIFGKALVAGVPLLVDLSTTARSVSMRWKLPSYQENRCPLYELRIITAGVASSKAVIKVPIVDSPLRSDVNVTIEGLSPDCVYQSLVSLWNIAGSSRNVSVSYQTI